MSKDSIAAAPLLPQMTTMNKYKVQEKGKFLGNIIYVCHFLTEAC